MTPGRLPTQMVVAVQDPWQVLKEGVSRRNWLAHEYVTAAPIKWGEVAKSVYEDLPKIKMELEAAIAELDK
ncbi:uncharacterized protein LAESUDRAFT_726281 [Laetiporus sulphureus 93-53]|uniref:Uncharacterized protein n=1 Tax=Laetiporus sulphureus 93-53 TaxID=1314785 RepID=A0A165E1M7_9APHY|nr:uncharacterized protein LAESUDRAFT_726281 [Laetiporus sulphureus 93-53]KZT06074.1 hypothetical protein LAESUDRAFT_726281 [Laetiporus sulphureus 93-53]